jgi:putative DNA-invertase from lambdoid prophage Rac
LLGVFAKFEPDILRERVKAGIAHARSNGKSSDIKDKVLQLKAEGLNDSQIPKKLKIGRTNVSRLLDK